MRTEKGINVNSRHRLSLGILVLFAAVIAFGQANQGSITGTVHDQTGAVVPSAPIEVKNTATGAVISSGASETGNFAVPVPTGTYELTISVKGFKKFVQTGIPVNEGTATRRDVQLEVGAVSDVVSVTDTAPLLKTETGDISYRVASQTANQLPVLQLGGQTGLGAIRSPLAMTTLLPGVQYSPAGQNGIVFQTLTINGLPANSQTFNIEGQDATPSLWRGVGTERSQGGVDAIEAMTVQTSNFAAEFGKAGGAAINYTMKSGTNQYHGTAYDYFVNEFLHAGTPDTDYADQPARFAYKSGQHIRNIQRRNDYGATFGGPIVIPKIYDGHDKTFFFFSFEQFRESQQIGTGLATVPTADYRKGNFAMSGCNSFDPASATCLSRTQITQNGQPAVDILGNAVINGGVYDPNSYRVINGTPVRTLYPGNQVPVTSFDKVSANIQNLFPLPNNANLLNNYAIPSYQNWKHSTIPSFKINHSLSPTLRTDFYWGQTYTNQPNANGFDGADFPWTAAQFNSFHNHTIRANFDATLAPTLLLHVGLGYFYQQEPNRAVPYDQSKIGLPGAGAVNAFPAADVFPTIGGICGLFGCGAAGGFSPGIGASFDATAWEQKPTANLSLTWVKGNHTYKFGGDMTIEAYITQNKWRANGNFTFGNAQSGNPWENGQVLNLTNPTGFGYASFLLGQPNTMQLAQQTDTKLGGHAFAFYAQDNWKVTRKLTIEYGLRYDFQTYLSEQYGRHASASFSTFNPSVGLKGGLAYEGSCGCKLSSNYPFAFGPRFNLAYQVMPKTVIRAGVGVNYNVVQTPAGNNFSVGDFYSINNPGYGISPLPLGLQGGDTFYTGNPYGNTAVIWPVFDPGRLPTRSTLGLSPESPFSMYHPGSRPGRIIQWSIGVQHEVIRNLVVEVSYVGNRGAWFYSPLLDTQGMNSLGGGRLGLYGLDINNPDDRALLGQNIATNGVINPLATAKGIVRPYVGFPDVQTVGQAIRPVPQWGPGSVNSYLGPYRGSTWYDALQLQATKRYSHGLDMTANITYAHAMVLGSSADTDFFFAGRPAAVDPFNRNSNKQLNQLVQPLKSVISGTYTTPGFASQGIMRVASAAVKDWQIGAVLQYQSGQLLQTPTSNNLLTSQLRLFGPGNFGAVANFNPWNYTPGAPFFKAGFDPNGSFDPRAYNAASPANSGLLSGGFSSTGTCAVATCSWTDPAAGKWGSTAPYLEGFRWRRRPSEAVSIGRNFRIREGKIVFNVRAEFQNILNRHFYNAPTATNPLAPITTTTLRGNTFATGGYGVVNTLVVAGSNGSAPRTGTIVARLTF